MSKSVEVEMIVEIKSAYLAFNKEELNILLIFHFIKIDYNY